jgi:pyridoxal phosphate enzyme (YggS family)
MARSKERVLENVATVRAAVADACERASRDPTEVTIVAVGKTVDATSISWVVEAGLVDVGENYVQELRAKHDAVPGARWHFIGTLQSSSARHVARLADAVQTAIPGHACARLARRSAELGRTLPVLVEVDFTGERNGVAPEATIAACDAVAALEGVSLRGLMTIAPIQPAAGDPRPFFRRLRELLDPVRERHPEATELSMGMSLDYEVAVGEGATMVRIGTALYGARPSA